MSTLVTGVRGLTSRLLHLHAGGSKSEVRICRGLAGVDVESYLAHEANRWAIERHLLWWGRASMGRGPMLTGWARQSRPRSRGGRGPGRLADEAKETMAALREVHHALRQREPLRPPPDNEPLIHGLCSPCSANGNRPVHRRTTNRSSMACALPASLSNGGRMDPRHVEGQLSCAGVRTRSA